MQNFYYFWLNIILDEYEDKIKKKNKVQMEMQEYQNHRLNVIKEKFKVINDKREKALKFIQKQNRDNVCSDEDMD